MFLSHSRRVDFSEKDYVLQGTWKHCRAPQSSIMFSLLVLHSQQNILNIFTSSPCKIETKQNKKNAFQDHQPGQQLGLKNRMPLVVEPSGQDEPGPACSWVPACSWDPLTMGECSGRNLCAAQSGTLCSCNSSYEFNPYIFCRFIPHDLKERYSIMLPMVAMSLLWVTSYTNPQYLFLYVIPCHAVAF